MRRERRERERGLKFERKTCAGRTPCVCVCECTVHVSRKSHRSRRHVPLAGPSTRAGIVYSSSTVTGRWGGRRRKKKKDAKRDGKRVKRLKRDVPFAASACHVDNNMRTYTRHFPAHTYTYILKSLMNKTSSPRYLRFPVKDRPTRPRPYGRTRLGSDPS